jgi:hypothetical protein
MFIAGIILHACGQFQLLQSSLTGLEDTVSQRIRTENGMANFETRFPASNTDRTSKIYNERYDNDFGNKSGGNNISGRHIRSLKNFRELHSNMIEVHMDMNKEIFLSLKDCIVHHQIILR